MVILSRVGKRHTVVIPKEVRREVPVREGEMIVWNVDGDRIILKPASFKRLAGIVSERKRVETGWVKQALEKEISGDVTEAIV